MKNPEPTLLTREIAFTFLGYIGLTRKGSRLPVWLRLPPTSYRPILSSRNQTFTVQDTRF